MEMDAAIMEATKEQLKKTELQRIGKNFAEELREIQDRRLESGVDKTRTSIKKLTNLLVLHNTWKLIKNEMITFDLSGALKVDEE